MVILYLYLAAMNIAAFTVMCVDKRRAIRHRWRVPERVLFLLSALGGSIGALLGMWLIRHKTKHWYFVVGMPAILVIHIVIAVIISHLQ